ncbi:MAG: hypothetical protein U0575_08370 [Phycisphaerales bacterium]
MICGILLALAVEALSPRAARGADCCSAHTTPCCDNETCCTLVCAEDVYCCTVQWDETCADQAAALVACGCVTCPPSSHNCFVEGTAGCLDVVCCVMICAQDAFCCQTVWDVVCVAMAGEMCDGCGAPLSGECCTPHVGPYCENRPCCILVCDEDPSCCDTAWDVYCVAWAYALPVCGCQCPVSDHGCFEIGAPGCDAERCCLAVCAIDGHCCATIWDAACVDLAAQLCEGCGDPISGACCSAHSGPFCDDAACCDAICANDQFCCSITWDSFCVYDAYTSFACGCPCPASDHSCLTAGGPGCTDQTCCGVVCVQDPFCCLTIWDDLCIFYAVELCDACATDGAGCCFSAHDGVGCNVSGCCQLVCAADPSCCDIAWDAFCALDAKTHCCIGDIKSNGVVDGGDIGMLFADWGGPGPGDINCDGVTNGADLGLLLQHWGPCSP